MPRKIYADMIRSFLSIPDVYGFAPCTYSFRKLGSSKRMIVSQFLLESHHSFFSARAEKSAQFRPIDGLKSFHERPFLCQHDIL